jgi:hypothetical protein
MWAADIFVELAPGWCSGMPPRAAASALDSVRDDPDCVATAFDSARVGQAVVPTLRVQAKAVVLPEAEHAAWLDETEAMFRSHMNDTRDGAFVRSVERVRIRAGEAVCVEIVSSPEPALPFEVVQIQYYVPSDNGPMALWFACDPRDLPTCRDAFDQMAQTFLFLQRA